MVYRAAKSTTLLSMVASLVFVTPWIALRVQHRFQRRNFGPRPRRLRHCREVWERPKSCEAQRISLVSIAMHFVSLAIFVAYVAATSTSATKRDCYVQEVVCVSFWCLSTWSIYIFQYKKQLVVTMSTPGAAEPPLSVAFRVLAYSYAPVLLVGMPFWVSQSHSSQSQRPPPTGGVFSVHIAPGKIGARRSQINGMCPWIMHARWRFMFLVHTVLDTAISLVGLVLFAKPLLALRATSSAARSNKVKRIRAIAKRNALASLVAIVSTFLQTLAQYALEVGERSPFLFWTVISQDLAWNVVSICLSYPPSENLGKVLRHIRYSRSSAFLFAVELATGTPRPPAAPPPAAATTRVSMPGAAAVV